MRNGLITALLAVATPALAEPGERLEASGFFGVDYFGDDIGLGGSPAPEQRPQTAPTFGGRLTYLPLQIGEAIPLRIGVEADLAFTPAWTGYGFDGPRRSYFAPVFGYHANVLLRLGNGWMQPHVTAGGGGETVASSSEYMAKETDGVWLFGSGATFPMADRWLLRFDARMGVTEAIMDNSTTNTFEAHLSIGARFGSAPKREPVPMLDVIVEQPEPPEPDKDSDGDGMPDRLDACPAQAEAVNGVDDDDGCPEPDPDGDGLVGAADKCPDRAEDFDKWQDDDGCVDDDNDQDGVPDAKDACPNEPENKNGIADDDGCADEIPPAVVAALKEATTVKFERNRARLSKTAKAALDKSLVAMLNNPRMKITITAHTDDMGAELAKKRADVVKFYLIEQGVAPGNLTTVVGPAVADNKAPIIVLSMTL